MKLRKRICVISLALPIEVDPRTSRQVVYLAQQYDVTLIGYGTPPADWTTVTWRPVERQVSRLRLLFELLLLAAGRVLPLLYDIWFSTRPRYQEALRYALESEADAYHACDWATLVVCEKAARQTGARLVFDADEYWTLENETSRLWQLFFSPLIDYTLRKYAPRIEAAITVSQPIADRYQSEYGFESMLMFNVPDYEVVETHPVKPDAIRLIHHGAARRNRYLEVMIDALAQLDSRFTLHLMLVPPGSDYIAELQRYAEQHAPGRVEFREPVHPFEITRAIVDGDIGLCFIPPTTYTYRMTLPNKLFEFLMAGMAVVSGPSPAMADVVRAYDVGWVLDGFTAADLVRTLNALTVEQIEAARANARAAAKTLNAEAEYAKLLALYERLFTTDGRTDKQPPTVP